MLRPNQPASPIVNLDIQGGGWGGQQGGGEGGGLLYGFESDDLTLGAHFKRLYNRAPKAEGI